MKKQFDDSATPERPRLKKETLRGLGFAELDAVQGGNQVEIKPARTRNCLEPE
jgi:hypothetical protein